MINTPPVSTRPGQAPQAFVERERLQLNADAILLVREDGMKGTLASVVADVLVAHARPGWARLVNIAGVPEGWVAFAGIQLLSPPFESKVPELVPLARDLLTIAGGIRIPSRIRKWSAAAPPEIRASLQSAPEFEISVVSLEDDSVVDSWRSAEGVLVVRLADDPLDPGDYRVELRLRGAKDPIQQATLRLRNGDGHESEEPEGAPVEYRIGDGEASLGAIGMAIAPVPDNAVTVTGIHVDGHRELGQSEAAPKQAAWMQRPQVVQTTAPAVHIASPEAQSCVRTGAHHLVFPTFGDGPKQKYISGECKYCGMVKRSPGWAWKAAKKQGGANSPLAVDVANLPPVATGSGELWAGALDAVRHLRTGTARELTNLATQIEPGALFGGTLATTLETLGHIDVERSADGAVARWSVNEAQLAVRPDSTVEAVGYWSPTARAWLRRQASECNAEIVESLSNGQPPRFTVAGLTDEVLDMACDAGISVVDDPAWSLMCALPPLSAVADALARAPLPGFKAAERFDTEAASWVATADVDRPGAYRLTRGFERLYVVRTASDVVKRESARATVQLVKYIAAAADGKPLAVYLESKSTVFVPRGCDLPGLYARAAVLAAGAMPRPAQIKVGATRRKVLAYTGIDRPTADRLHAVLNS